MIKNDVDKPIINYDIDSILLDDESRSPLPFFNVYRLNCLIAAGSQGGKTTFLIKLLLNKIVEFDAIILIAPNETLKSGLYKNFINKYVDLFGDNKIMFVFDLSSQVSLNLAIPFFFFF